MILQAEEPALEHVHHVVGAVRPGEAPVEHGDGRLGHRHEAALHIGGTAGKAFGRGKRHIVHGQLRLVRDGKTTLLSADARLREGRHAVVAGGGGLEERHGQRRRRGLAQPHVDVEQRPLADRLQQPRVAGLGRAMRHQAMVERVPVDGVKHRRRRGAGIAVEQHRNAADAGGQHRAGDGRELLAADRRQQGQRIARAIAAL